MEINVNTYNIETLSEEYHRIGNNLDDIISEYNTLGYEILNDIESENTDEIKIAIDEIKNLLDKGFLTVKKHESFILNTCQEYNETDKYLADEALIIADNVYSGISSYNAFVVSPAAELLPSVNPYVTPLVRSDLPKSDVSKVEIKGDKSNVIITGLKDAIVSGTDKKFDMFRVVVGLVGLIVPGAVITGITIVLPYDKLLEGINDADGVGDGTGGLSGSSGREYDKLLNLVGQAFQTNYNLIDVLLFEFILNVIINGSLFIGEFGKYNKLSDLSYNSFINENKETEEYNEEENTDTYDEDTEEENTISEEYEEEISPYDRLYEASNINSLEEADRIVAKATEDLELEELSNDKPEENSKSNMSATAGGSSGGGAGGISGGSGGLGGGGLSSGGSSGLSSSSFADTIGTVTNAEEPISKVNYKNGYNQSGNFYDRILSADAANRQQGFGKKKMAAVGTGVAALGGIGGFGAISNFATNSLTAEKGAGALNFVIGAMNFSNIFDLVGNAQMCSIGWLSELTNAVIQ